MALKILLKSQTLRLWVSYLKTGTLVNHALKIFASISVF